MTGKRRTAVLISGRGSNMASLIAAAQSSDYPAQIALVIASNPTAAGIKTAASHDIQTAVVHHREFSTREAFETVLDETLQSHAIDLVCLAGFMRVLTSGFVAKWFGRIINIHPSLLPSYKGLRTHERALADGVKIHGCSVHFVVPEMDAGPIIMQAAVPVLDGDDPEVLAARVLAQEHVIYPRALQMLAAGQLEIVNGKVTGVRGSARQSLISPEGQD